MENVERWIDIKLPSHVGKRTPACKIVLQKCIRFLGNLSVIQIQKKNIDILRQTNVCLDLSFRSE